MLFEKINTGHVIEQDYYADVELIIRKSTRMLDNGPFGEEAATPELQLQHPVSVNEYLQAVHFAKMHQNVHLLLI